MPTFNETFDLAHWDQAKFDTYRFLKDDAADEVARFVVNSPHHVQVYQALNKVVKNNDVITIDLFAGIMRERAQRAAATTSVENMAGASVTAVLDEKLTDEHHDILVIKLNEYFNDLALFDFVKTDMPTLQAGSDIFNFYYVHCTFALAVRSLMKQYAAYNATQVLTFTKLLQDYPYRRIMETVQFVMDIMDPAGFTAEGCAIRSIQKLRLVHAMIRIRIENQLHDQYLAPGAVPYGPWNTKEWGEPINQQDMIFAVHTFSVEMIDALIGIGVFDLQSEYDKGQIEYYYMMWHHVGRALGVRDEINPVTYTEGKQLQEKIYQKEFTATPTNADKLVPPLVGFVAKLLSVTEDSKVYSVVRYYNNTPADKKIFKEILNIDLDAQSNKKFYDHIYRAFRFLKVIFVIALKFISDENKKKDLTRITSLHYDLLGKIIYVATDGQYKTGKSFRIADGFGLKTNDRVLNYSKYKQHPLFGNLFKMLILKIWHLIVHLVKHLFKKKKK